MVHFTNYVILAMAGYLNISLLYYNFLIFTETISLLFQNVKAVGKLCYCVFLPVLYAMHQSSIVFTMFLFAAPGLFLILLIATSINIKMSI